VSILGFKRILAGKIAGKAFLEVVYAELNNRYVNFNRSEGSIDDANPVWVEAT
jgi:hypothetical protein